MKFSYQARDAQGKQQSGVIEAVSEQAAAVALGEKGWFVTRLAAQSQMMRPSLHISLPILRRRMSKKESAVFFRQLSVMLLSGVPVVRALFIIGTQQKRGFAKQVILDLSRSVQEGNSLSRSLAAFPLVFNSFVINIVRSGEASGDIAKALSLVAENDEREGDVISQIKQVATYPIFIMIVLSIVLVVVITQLTPQLKNLVASAGGTASPSINATIAFYTFLEGYWYVIMGGFAVVIISILGYFRTLSGKHLYDRLTLRLPVIGPVFRKIFLARFCQNIAALLAAGVSIGQAFSITEGVMSNGEYRNMISEMAKEVASGSRLSQAMASRSTYFTPFIVQMVLVGEETGKLSQTMSEVSRFYQKEVKQAVDMFSKFLEPATIVIMGGIVAFIAISMFSAIYGIIGSLQT